MVTVAADSLCRRPKGPSISGALARLNFSGEREGQLFSIQNDAEGLHFLGRIGNGQQRFRAGFPQHDKAGAIHLQLFT